MFNSLIFFTTVALAQSPLQEGAIALQDGMGRATDLRVATYDGRGVTTGREYQLHLRAYAGRADLFSAVLLRESYSPSPTAWLGVISQEPGSGEARWFPLRIENGTQITTEMTGEPSARLTTQLDREGRVRRLMMQTGEEAVEFSGIRRAMWLPQITPGYYVYVPRTNARMSVSPQGQLNGTDPEHSAWSSTLREEFPGVFAEHARETTGYVGAMSDTILHLMIPLRLQSCWLICAGGAYRNHLVSIAADQSVAGGIRSQHSFVNRQEDP